MPQFFSGTLDFVGERFDVEHLAINEAVAPLTAIAHFNGAPWMFEVTGRRVPSTANVYEFKGPCRYAGSNRPSEPTPGDYILRVKVNFEDGELDVEGEWWEAGSDEKYAVSGLLEETRPAR